MTLMLEEISEQPTTIAATIEALRPDLPALRALALDCRSVVFYARGSSDTAAVYGRYLCEIEARVPCSLGAPSIATLYDGRPDLRDTLAVVVSQSGRTGEMVAVAEWARRQGARTLAITNGTQSPLADAVDHALITRAGTERAIPATKTHTAQLTAIAILAAALAPDSSTLLAALADVPAAAGRVIEARTPIERAATAIADANALVVTGRAFTMSSALEIALKAQETCGLPAFGMSAADLQHGPQAIERSSVPVLVIAATTGVTLPTLTACAATARGRGSVVVTIGGDERLRGMSDVAIEVPVLAETVAPIVAVISGQLLVEALARSRGADADRPPGLSKVTQTTE